MKQPWKTFMMIITYAVGIVIALSSTISPFGGNTTLNTKKIDRHIENLKQLSWFQHLYEDEHYRRSFYTNRKVRSYLQSSIRVKRLKKSKYAQVRFVALLEKQAQ